VNSNEIWSIVPPYSGRAPGLDVYLRQPVLTQPISALQAIGDSSAIPNGGDNVDLPTVVFVR